jgi:hypothetical protein
MDTVMPDLAFAFPASAPQSRPPTASLTSPELTPDAVLQLGLGFWGSKTLLSAVELGVFTQLGHGPMKAKALIERLGLHPRSARDFLDALVALGMLNRDGDAYANTPTTALFLDRGKTTYTGGVLEMANARLYRFWGSLTTALRTGEPQNEVRLGEDVWAGLYADPQRLAGFLHFMTGLSQGAARVMAEKFPWEEYRTFADVGAAEGGLPVQIAIAHPHLKGIGFDLPPVEPHFKAYVSGQGLSHRLSFQGGDFFADPLPRADVIVMGHVLHDWNLEERKLLIRKAYDALPAGGALIVYEAIIDDERRQNAFGLLMSLNMLIETAGGADYTGAECSAWMREAGFRETYVRHLLGPDSMAVGIK